MKSKVQSKHGGANVRFPPPFVYLLGMGAGAVIQRWVAPVGFPFDGWARIALGIGVAALGLVLVLSAGAWFKRTGQEPAPWKPSPELITSGIYRHTRNPMYVGMSTLQIGLGIALGNAWIAGLAPLSLAVVHLIAVRPEEVYLGEKFGESYERYKASVRRYL